MDEGCPSVPTLMRLTAASAEPGEPVRRRALDRGELHVELPRKTGAFGVPLATVLAAGHDHAA